MKKVTVMVVLIVATTTALLAGDVKSSGARGMWSATSSWIGGVVPGPADRVTISNGDTITIDVTNITVAGLTVGEGWDGIAGARLRFSRTTPVKLVINGNLMIADSSTFKVESSTNNTAIIDSLVITGNIKSTGGFLLRTGSATGPTIHTMTVVFTGSANDTVSLAGSYASTNNQWGAFAVNKSGSGRVVLNCSVYLPGGSSSLSDAQNPIIYLTRGIVQTTGSNALIHLWTTSTIIGGSDSSYVIGSLGRGISNSSNNISKTFPVGDEKGYRPITIRSTNAGTVTGHHAVVSCVSGDANVENNAFAGGIDKVTTVRYYKVSYRAFAVGAATSMGFDRFILSYGLRDGVAAGNQNLRIAVADTARQTWTGIGPTLVPYTTALDSLPRSIRCDSTASAVTLADGKYLFLALARAAGTTENTLDAPSTWIWEGTSEVPSKFGLNQNYPNPFNPATQISFSLDVAGFTSLKVYDLMGREVATLVDARLDPGTYISRWDAKGVSSGLYFYRLQTGNHEETRKMILMK